ncbi:UbiA family prenyltransferase [Hyphomicrobium sp. CS1GBMeth3]|uniref:UbiA family prenyltransferase n=1 Tax=Hyphomicrobium sp. CS1GBMeth3 TaxID=1892845 RepID=UPI0009FA8559|nr:UbiA family prenyltransferase [Hyphomicrobium sp. CS1GBMeth3]
MSVRPIVDTAASPDRAESAAPAPIEAVAQQAEARAGESAPVPLLVDLDHTLVRTDLLIEMALAYVAANPLRIAHLIAWTWEGRAQLKRKLAEAIELDPELVPINDKVVALAAEAKRQGRPVYLVTASDELLAKKFVARFPFFDGVLSSDGVQNLKGRHKAAAVGERFPDGYDYIGDSAADLHVWRNAREVIAVAPKPATRRRLEAFGKPTTIIEGGSTVRALIKASRLHQWAKNTLIFVPAVLSGTISDPGTVLNCALAFLALGLVAVGTYLINDILDITHDRRHWSKRFRPIAAGDLSIGTALVASAITIAAGLAIGAALAPGVLTGLAAYLVLTLAYSIHIKRLPILDVVVLAALFTLRLAIGIAATQVYASPWLLVFSMALFTSLSTAKRYTEIQRTEAKGEAAVSGRGYFVVDAPLVLGLGIATGTASVLIMVLYLIFDAFSHQFYGNPHWLWLFPTILFLWIGRVWLIGQRGQLHDDPVAFALKDRASLVLGGVMAIAFVLAWTGAPL